MTRRFLAIGECMVELSPAGAGLFAMGFAGDTFNTAWYMRRLATAGVEVAYLSAVGDDEPSVAMAAFMRAAGVVPELAVREGGHAGLYMITVRNGERSFSYWRDTSAARTLGDDLDALPGIGAGAMVFFSGITLAILSDAARERLLSLLADARAGGARIAFDPNLRPRLWPDLDAMRRWVTDGARAADIALPSFEDDASAFGDADPAVTAARYRALGCGLVVVKDGPGPVLVDGPDGQVLVNPPPVTEVVDTTAAGDAFNAGFLAALDAGAPLEDAARSGCRVAARVIGASGALVEVG